MKTALWLATAFALATVLWWLPIVDFVGAETVFAAAADGKALSSAPTHYRRGGAKRRITSPAPSFCCILWVGDSLKDIVTESEGGQMPSREEFNRRGGESHQPVPDVRPDSAVPDPQGESTQPMKEGESHRADKGSVPLPEHGPDLTPPRPPDAGGPGRVLVPAEPGPLLSAWGFVAWLPDGQLFKRAGGLFDDPDACAQARAARRQQAPDLRLSPCTRLEIGERDRL